MCNVKKKINKKKLFVVKINAAKEIHSIWTVFSISLEAWFLNDSSVLSLCD